MDTLRELRRFLRLLADEPKARRDLDEWFENTTVDDVYTQFESVAITGSHDRLNCVPKGLFKPEEIACFKANTSTFSTTGDEIEPTDVIRFLGQAHPCQAGLLDSIQACLSRLLVSHAQFPFSRPARFTQHALFRAIMLLTWRGLHFFKEYTSNPPLRTDRERLEYIFVALVVSDAGVGHAKQGDIVEVLMRLPFPIRPNPKIMPWRRLDSFERMAQRLDPVATKAGYVHAEGITVKALQPLAQLIDSFSTATYAGTAGASLAQVVELDVAEFVDWGTRFQLLDVLDKLFGSLLLPVHLQCKPDMGTSARMRGQASKTGNH